jgi:hypothetical protein
MPGRGRQNPNVVPDWFPPLIAATLVIAVLNLALFEQRRRARRGSWNERFLRELRVWDGRLPDELNRPGKQSW